MLLLFFFSGALFCASAQLTTAQFNFIANTMVNILQSRKELFDIPAQGRRPGDTPAGWVRLCFHDAGSWDPSQSDPMKRGGAHGNLIIPCATDSGLCEREAVENRGLPAIADDLEGIFQFDWGLGAPFSAFMSRADFWQLAGKLAIEHSSNFAIVLPFSIGRRDWNTMFPGTLPRFEHRLPHPTDTIQQLQDTFFRMGFTSWTQIVALLGAHCLGRSRAENIGYHGKWVPGDANVFSNVYYQTLLGPSNAPNRWFLQTVPGGQPQYVLPSELGQTITDTTVFMLPADITTFWVTQNSAGFVPSCNVTLVGGSCPVNPTSDTIVQTFANNQGAFFSAFAQAWTQMATFGGDSLTQIFAGSSAGPAPSPSPSSPSPSSPSPSPSSPTPSKPAPSGKTTSPQGKTPAPSGKSPSGGKTPSSGGKSGKRMWTHNTN